MRLTIKNAEAAYVDLASKPHRLDVDIDGVETEDLLMYVDINTAINYYGVTELLDTIGEEHLKSHLENLKDIADNAGYIQNSQQVKECDKEPREIRLGMSYLDYKCKKCNTDFHYQVPRGFFLKHVLGFLPIKIYWCPKCTTNRYVWIGSVLKVES